MNPIGRGFSCVRIDASMAIQREDHPIIDVAHPGSPPLDAADLPRDPFRVANTRDRCDGRDLDCRAAADGFVWCLSLWNPA